MNSDNGKHATCVICDGIINQYGHNAEPVDKGRCCTICNETIVIPARKLIMAMPGLNRRARRET